MKRYLVALVLALFAPFVLALDSSAVSSAGFSKLSEAQKAAIVQQVAQQAEAAGDSPIKTTDVQKVSEWVDLGTKIGQGFAGAAKEVGVAANEFANTPVGKWTMALIIWKVLGTAIVHIFGSLFMLVAGSVLFFVTYRRIVMTEITYDPERHDLFGRSRVKSLIRHDLSSDSCVWLAVITLVTVALAAVCLFTM